MITTKNFKNTRYNKGMTLIELLVVLGIFMIVSGLTIFDYGRFRSTVSLQNLADDVSLAVRQAQNYAIGVRSQTGANPFLTGYGIHFATTNPDPTDIRAGSNKIFILYNDFNNNNVYESTVSSSSCNASTFSSNNECINMFNITSNDIISAICPNGNGDGVTNCTTGYAEITFHRPNPDAYICTVATLRGSCSAQVLNGIDIVIKNVLSNAKKIITISSIGQISVK